ncbi:MAG: DUF4386 domain-containing protein [Pyrinomonadaceae bacterium]
MKTNETTQTKAGSSPRMKARAAGLLWVVVIVTGLAAFMLRSPLVVRGDAAATATNILANESLFRLAFVSDLVAGICYVGVSVLLFRLLQPVSGSVSLLSAFFGLAGVIVGSATSLTGLVSFAVLRDGQYANAFSTTQLQSLASMFLNMDANGFAAAMVFFGLQVMLVGILIVRSTFLPRILGILLAIGGSSYVVSSLATFLAPAVGARLMPFIVPLALLGEGSLTVWLLAKGVNEQRWREQASRA